MHCLDAAGIGLIGLPKPGVAGRVSPRRAIYFLCFAKESSQRKATLLSATPALPGQPAVLENGGVRANSLRSNMHAP